MRGAMLKSRHFSILILLAILALPPETMSASAPADSSKSEMDVAETSRDLSIPRRDNDAQLKAQWAKAKEHVELGETYRLARDYHSALHEFQAAEALMLTIVGSNPTFEAWRRDLVVAQQKVGDVMLATGNLTDAESAYRTALTSAELLITDRSGNPEWRRNVHVLQNKLGDILQARRDYQKALAAYETAHDVMSRLNGEDPANAQWRGTWPAVTAVLVPPSSDSAMPRAPLQASGQR